MEKFTEENLNVICDEVYDEIKNEGELDDDSIILSEVNVTLNVIKKFILKMQDSIILHFLLYISKDNCLFL